MSHARYPQSAIEASQRVLVALEALRVDPRTEALLETHHGVLWLPLHNLLNFPEEYPLVADDYRDKLSELSSALYEGLIDIDGQCAPAYYHLKNVHKLNLCITARDSFGPLGAALQCPNANWKVSYG